MATDGSEKGNMGAGCIGLNDNALRHHVQIGRAEEGAGPNRPEMGALAEALCVLHPETGHYFFSATASTR